MIPWLSCTHPLFPDTETALRQPNGLLAAGGNLTQDTLLSAYQHGIFPWFNEGEPILWWSPDPRMVITPGEIIISRSLRKILRKELFNITFDSVFSQVIEECSRPRLYTKHSWISYEMKKAYCALHAANHAHSVEVWTDKQLVGGLYGVAIGQVFFGESMFSKQSNTSKIAFAWLCKHLLQQRFQLIDCQVHSTHLESLGASTISRTAFIKLLDSYCSKKPYSANWIAERQWNDN